jgi:hypothetical protein
MPSILTVDARADGTRGHYRVQVELVIRQPKHDMPDRVDARLTEACHRASELGRTTPVMSYAAEPIL